MKAGLLEYRANVNVSIGGDWCVLQWALCHMNSAAGNFANITTLLSVCLRWMGGVLHTWAKGMLCESWQPISVQSPCRSRARGGVAQRQIGDPGSPFPLTWSTSICPSLWWGRALTLLVPLTNTGNKTYDLLCNVKSCKTTLSHSDFKKCRYAVTSDFLWPHCTKQLNNNVIILCKHPCMPWKVKRSQYHK